NNSLNSGSTPNPWSFITLDTICPNIVSTLPINNTDKITLTTNIVVSFSEEMNITSVTFACQPDPDGWNKSWSGGNTVLTLSHDPFDSFTEYTFKITSGFDLAGNPLSLGNVPNPWSFTTADTVFPFIMSTLPHNNTENITLATNIVISFSEIMNKSSVTFSCMPDLGGWNTTWSGGDTVLTLSHDPFVSFTEYTFQISSGFDPAGNPLSLGNVSNPWSFTTVDAISPNIVSTLPINNTDKITLTTNIVVSFSEEMNITSVTFACQPDPDGWNKSWSGGNTVLTLSHNPFDSFTRYTFQITSGFDLAGNALSLGNVPNPWSFTTADTVFPVIMSTLPYNNTENISLTTNIVVSFSEIMNKSSMTFSCMPDPGGWNTTWSGGDTVVTFSHHPFTGAVKYIFQITSGFDLVGNALSLGNVPNPWSITTIDTTLPLITSTVPHNGSVDIPPNTNVTVSFSKQMDIESVTFACIPDPGNWDVSWSKDNKVVTFEHDLFTSSTNYIFQIISGKDIGGHNLSFAGAQNPWSFIVTDFIAPNIKSTLPIDMSENITLNSNITISFTESMNPITVTFVCLPDPGGWDVIWSGNNTIVTFTHANHLFSRSTKYIFQITSGFDLGGNSLISGDVPNPWSFKTIQRVKPFIRLTGPNGGEELLFGSNYPITWNAEGDFNSTPICLYLSFDNGEQFTIIKKWLPNNGYYNLSMPFIETDNALIKATATDIHQITVTDTSNAQFSIFMLEHSIEFLTPSWGTLWGPGVHNISWEISNTTGLIATPLNLYYSIDGGKNWVQLVVGVKLTNKFNWEVTEVPSSKKCLVRLDLITVTGGKEVYTSELFYIDTSPPIINHSKSMLTKNNENLIINTKIEDDFKIIRGELIYRLGSEPFFRIQNLSCNGIEYYTTVVPQTTQTIEYYILATDGVNTAKSEIFRLNVISTNLQGTEPDDEDHGTIDKENNGQIRLLTYLTLFLFLMIIILILIGLGIYFVKSKKKPESNKKPAESIEIVKQPQTKEQIEGFH
ncbi:Ig-like domain-containing protein, partial [[Eubacterium] cellulosolvens]